MTVNQLQQIMNRDGSESYVCLATGQTMTNEFGVSPNGNKFNGCWVLRDINNNYVGHDRYSNDLAGINNLEITYTD